MFPLINNYFCNISFLTTSLFFVFVTCMVWYFLNYFNYLRKLPPGPIGIPFFGCLLQLWMSHTAPHSWYLQQTAKYGDMISMKLGSNLIVCVGDAKILRNLFNRNDSTGRPQTPLNKLLEGLGIILSEGNLWRQQRVFLHEKFRALGVKLMSNQRFEKYIMLEIEEFLMTLKQTSGIPISPVKILGRHVHNVICQLMMSFRFEENDQAFSMFYKRISKGMKLYGSIQIGEHIPAYLKIPGKNVVMKEMKRNLEDVSEFHANHLSDRKLRRERENYEPADLIDYYLDLVESGGDNTSKFEDADPEKQIVQVMNDLFSAGMETSQTTLGWILVMILREPEVAKKVREELETVVSCGQLVTLAHRQALPYTEAVIFETLRRQSVVPLGTTHVNSETWYVDGYTIPAGSHIVPLINKINMDPTLYPEPEKFKPERFIDNGRIYIPNHFLAFGVGRRVCLGEQLARMELFLFFANLMNNFEFHLPKGQAMPSLEGQLGTTHAPYPFMLTFKDLNQKPKSVQNGHLNGHANGNNMSNGKHSAD